MEHGPARNLSILGPCRRNPNPCMGLNKSQGKEAWMNIRHVANENENDEVEEDMLKTKTSFKREEKELQ
jgi:hypothetical protein